MQHKPHKRHMTDGTLPAIRRYQEITRQYLDLILSGIQMPDVLDVGASEGWFGNGRPEWNYLAIDPTPDCPSVLRGTIDDISGREFDLVVYNHVLEHIYDSRAELLKAAAVMRPGAHLFINVPDASSSWAWTIESHAVLFNETILKRLVESIGLSFVEAFYVTFREDKKELWFLAKKP